MTELKSRALAITEILEKLYPETPIPLDHKDPYTLLVSVLLSAQCTDVRVNQVTPFLFDTMISFIIFLYDIISYKI